MHYINRLLSAAVGLIVGMAVGTQFLGPALGLIVPPNYPPRQFPTQQIHYIRFAIPFNACVPTGNCSVKIGAVPYNAFLSKVDTYTTTAWNSTTNLLALGTSSGGATIRAATTIAAAANTIDTAFAGIGLAATGNGATQTGGNGGFDVWATLSFTGTAPSAGQTTVVIEYYGANDGSCAPVPMNQTAGAC